MTPLGEAAIRLGAKGLRVFPCWPRRKEPRFKDNLKLATVEPVIIPRWWSDGRDDSNIGIATGARSRIWVLDIDGHEGEMTLSELEAKHGALPPTIEVITGAGRHLYFRWPDNGAEVRNFQVRADLPEIDVRGEGGYVLAPPSVHPSGRVYTWSVDSAGSFAQAPDWLLKIVTQRSSTRKANGGATVAPTMPADWARLFAGEQEGSRRAAAIAKIFGHFARMRVDPTVAFAMVELFDQQHNSPPLGHDELVRICDDIAELELARRGD